MNKLPSFATLVTAALIGIAAESAWSDEATPNGSAVPAMQTPAPETGYVPGWYPPPPNTGGYAQPRQQPSQWPVSPPGYGQLPPYYPPHGQYRAVPAAPAVNPLSAELKQTQEQLRAKSAELDTAIATLEQHRQQITDDQQQNQMLAAERDRLRDDLDSRDKQLATLQADLQAAMEVIQQAQSENALSSQQLGTAMAQADTLKNELTELNSWLESQKTTLQNAELQTTPQALQQAQSETTAPSQLLSTAEAQAEAFNNELIELKAQLENQKITLQDTGQALAAVVAERDGLQKDLAACHRELTRAQGVE